MRSRFQWRGWDPERWTARFTAFERHPRVVDQRYLVNWNNKQARGYRSSDTGVYSSAYRSDMLEDRLRRALRGDRRVALPQLVDIMAVAGTGDMRAHSVLPLALRMLGRPRDPALRDAIGKLRAWRRAGGLRKDANGDRAYEHADAVRILDAWWPRWVRAQFRPRLGHAAYRRLRATVPIDNPPSTHAGSAYQGSWYGYVRKDLRTVLGRRVRGRYSREYCGRGSRKRCRRALRRSLRAAIAVPATEVYSGDPACEDGDQWCYDAISFRPVGGTTQPMIHWQNRPTYQQVVEVQARVPR